VVRRDGVLLALGEHNQLMDGETAERLQIRCRTVGDLTCTGVWESSASTMDEIIDEVAAARIAERGGRSDDKRSDASMEDRKKQGYFKHDHDQFVFGDGLAATHNRGQRR
jgi:sulfate adenylyltransferase subunit 2